MIIHNVAQGTTAWNQLRAGKPTASRFEHIVTRSGNRSESQDKYFNHLLAERVRGAYIDGFKSKYMELGNEYESRAIASYELSSDCDTYTVGFVTTDDGKIGCSPDRFIVGRKDRAVEAKSPTPAVHVSYLRASTGASKEYFVQLQGQLWVCELESVEIVSYCAGFPDANFCMYRDETFIREMAAHVRAFANRLDDETETFRERGWIKDAPEVPEPDGIGALGISDDDITALFNSYGWKEEEIAQATAQH